MRCERSKCQARILDPALAKAVKTSAELGKNTPTRGLAAASGEDNTGGGRKFPLEYGGTSVADHSVDTRKERLLECGLVGVRLCTSPRNPKYGNN